MAIDNLTHGYVLFMAKQENADLVWYIYYQNNILLLFISGSCKEFGHKEGKTILDEMSTVCWCYDNIK